MSFKFKGLEFSIPPSRTQVRNLVLLHQNELSEALDKGKDIQEKTNEQLIELGDFLSNWDENSKKNFMFFYNRELESFQRDDTEKPTSIRQADVASTDLQSAMKSENYFNLEIIKSLLIIFTVLGLFIALCYGIYTAFSSKSKRDELNQAGIVNRSVAIERCESMILGKISFKNTALFSRAYANYYVAKNKNVSLTMDFSVKNAFNTRVEYKARCIFDSSGSQEVSISQI